MSDRQERAVRFQQEKTDRETAQMQAKSMKQAAQVEAEAKRAATQRWPYYVEFLVSCFVENCYCNVM